MISVQFHVNLEITGIAKMYCTLPLPTCNLRLWVSLDASRLVRKVGPVFGLQPRALTFARTVVSGGARQV